MQASTPSRRSFLRQATGSVAGGAVVASNLLVPRSVHAAGSDELKVALIGCGNRGTGAAAQAISTAGPVKLWAMADAFEDRLQNSLSLLTSGKKVSQGPTAGLADKVKVPKQRQFVGLDAYKEAVDCVDVVVDASPPAFRPAHFAYAVEQGKHVFMEKPLATDAPGVRTVLKAAAEAKKKNLKVGVGLQRHHEAKYVDLINQVSDGLIGDLTFLRSYWNTGYPAKTPPTRGDMTEMEYQLRDWYFFTWLSGDHICEQHIHNLDVCNWIMQGHPVEANGMGGRQCRTSNDYGQIFDHHAVEFTYASGMKMFSQSRQILNCWREVNEHAHGTNGVVNFARGTTELADGTKATYRVPRDAPKRNPYQVEHDVLFDAIRNDKPHNEAEYGAVSTMTAIMGRMATYSGNTVTWDEAINSELSLHPETLAWDAPPRDLPDAAGNYAVAMPGITKAW